MDVAATIDISRRGLGGGRCPRTATAPVLRTMISTSVAGGGRCRRTAPTSYEPLFPHWVRDKTCGMTGGSTYARGTTPHMPETTGGWGSVVARSCDQILRCRFLRCLGVARRCACPSAASVCGGRRRERHVTCASYTSVCYNPPVHPVHYAFLAAPFASLCPPPPLVFLLMCAPIVLLVHF